jgi:hypothetical protein
MPGLNDSAYVIVSRTVVYTAVVDTAAPDANSLDSPGVAWTILGHIGDETGEGNATFTREGGDVRTKGSMTKKAIRQVVDPVVSGLDMDITQWDRESLALYVGTSGGTNPTRFDVAGVNDGVATERAVLVVWEDGVKRVAIYSPRGSITGRDNIDTASIEDAVAVPLHVGFLDSATINDQNGDALRYSWISPTLLTIS